MPDYGGEDPYGEPDTQRRDTKTLPFAKYEWPMACGRTGTTTAA
jgi:hypothetical protein